MMMMPLVVFRCHTKMWRRRPRTMIAIMATHNISFLQIATSCNGLEPCHIGGQRAKPRHTGSWYGEGRHEAGLATLKRAAGVNVQALDST